MITEYIIFLNNDNQFVERQLICHRYQDVTMAIVV